VGTKIGAAGGFFMAKWITSTKFKGLRWRLHPTRKHGVQPDKYFTLRYQKGGVREEEGLGWASEGWTEARAGLVLERLRAGARTGEGFARLADQRAAAEAKREEEERNKVLQERERVTVKEWFESDFLPSSGDTIKAESHRKQQEHFTNWIEPCLGRLPMKDVKAFHLEGLRSSMLKKGKKPRTIQYVMATFRRAWNAAQVAGLVSGLNPVKAVALPRVDNERRRYLSREEARLLLEELYRRSPTTYGLALVSLHTGMRFSEVAGLAWGCVDLAGGRLHILRTKGGKDRSVPMTRELKSYFSDLERGEPSELVFKSSAGGRIDQVPSTFARALGAVGINRGVVDPKMRFSFHGLRHTAASWLIEAGCDLYTCQRLLGHSTPTVTTRYAHVSDGQLEAAVRAMEARGQEKDESHAQVISLATRKDKI
jgi:integrase